MKHSYVCFIGDFNISQATKHVARQRKIYNNVPILYKL